MRGEIIHRIYIADGFDDDCDALIHRCLRAEKLTYNTFCEIWKDMKFGSVYSGRTSMVEIAELSEELIHTAKQYMMAKVNNFEETVAGLFLVYGVLNLQPYAKFAWLRLVPEDVHAVKRIELVARRQRRLDVLYVLGAVLTKHTQYHAEQRERGMEQVYRKYLDGYVGIDFSGFRPRGAFYRQTEELDLIRELAAVTDRYDTAKRAITNGKSDPSLSFINKALPGELDSSLRRIISGIPGLDDDDDIDAADVHYSNVQAIKERAMKTTVGSIRHLTSAAERTVDKTATPSAKEIKSKPGKVKTSSPTKTFLSPQKKNKDTDTSPKQAKEKQQSPITNAKGVVAKASTSKPPLKRKMRSFKRKPKKSKTFVSDSSSDSDMNMSDLDKGDSDLDIATHDDESNKPNEVGSKDEGEDNIQIGDVDIDALPTHATTEGDGLVYEIEIIDKFDKSKVPEVNNEDQVANVKPVKMPKHKKSNISLSRLGILPVSELDEKEKRAMAVDEESKRVTETDKEEQEGVTVRRLRSSRR